MEGEKRGGGEGRGQRDVEGIKKVMRRVEEEEEEREEVNEERCKGRGVR